jgi:hypothetical protein
VAMSRGCRRTGPFRPAGIPSHPCAHAKPPTGHSHTFWAGGTFNSYDENGNRVDDGVYELIDDHTFTFSPIIPMHFSVTAIRSRSMW